MGGILSVIIVAIGIPAWGIVIARDILGSKKAKREYEEMRGKIQNLCDLLTPAKEEADGVHKMLHSMVPYEVVSSKDDGVYEKWLSEKKKYLLEDCGLAHEFEAIYGGDWESAAEILPDRTGFSMGFKWRLRGFHNSPAGADLTRRWPEHEAVEALVLSRMGRLPKQPPATGPRIDVFPYPTAPFNRDDGMAWYKRIEDNLRVAGKPVTMYFETSHPFGNCGYYGPVFIKNCRAERMW